MTPGNWQLSVCWTQARHLSSSSGQLHLLHLELDCWFHFINLGHHNLIVGQQERELAGLFSGLGPGFMGSAWSETLKPKRHYTSWSAFWPVSYSCWVSSMPRYPCGRDPQIWPYHSAAGPPEYRWRMWGTDWTLAQWCPRSVCPFGGHSSSSWSTATLSPKTSGTCSGSHAPPRRGGYERLCGSWCLLVLQH